MNDTNEDTLYHYRIKEVPKVVDGDTFDVIIDQGFHSTLKIRVRLVDIDTYEIYGRYVHPKGQEAKDATAFWLENASDPVIRTYVDNEAPPVADGSFGRWIGDIYDLASGKRLTDYLKELGLDESSE